LINGRTRFSKRHTPSFQDLYRQLKDMVVAEGLVDFKFVIGAGGKSLCAIIQTLSDTQIAI
jgi:hypothetical protein